MTARTMSAAIFSINVEANIVPMIIPIVAANKTARTETTKNRQKLLALLRLLHIIFIILFVLGLEVIPLQYIMNKHIKMLPPQIKKLRRLSVWFWIVCKS